ncbi:peptidylprolyl isomerase [Pontixanthobacter gangjinensis]|uniref:Parvulin-like PPIase n=1 Tax=Pontixanthobacter gangjinensis TaxID=1028742 RepID=A0A6I4SRA1_9SPHN|nr:peptidylprolyl isomerase [Pontixanthobacter gangjinensis]MXO57556.1 peptidylprolyl isomerase [Pontixanthobacter gangjinensis]
MTFSKFFGSLAALGLAASPIALQAQDVATRTTENPLGIPADVNLLSDNDPNVRSATALVNGTVITGTDVDHRVALLVAQSEGELPPAELQRVRMQVLRNLIDETLQIQDANAQELPVSDAEVDQRYAQVASQNFSADPARMDSYLLGIGSSPASLKRQIRGEIAWTNVIRRNISPFVNVSEEEAREELARRASERGTEEYRLGEIYLSATIENREAVLENANQIVAQLQQGGNFVAYARQFSEASTSAVGGDLGFVRLNTLPSEMATRARQMSPGQLVGPFEVPGGLVIMYLIDKRQLGMADPRDAMLSLKQISIGFDPKSTDEQTNARVQLFTDAVARMRGCGDANAVAASIGAEVVENEIRARALPEQLQTPLLSIQVGQTTPPFGSVADGVRVLMLCGRDDPQSAAAATIEQIIEEKENERIQKRAQRYLRDLRSDAYIEYD